MTTEQIHEALLALNEARKLTINRPEAPDWKDEQAATEQWDRIHNLTDRAKAIEAVMPLFRVQFVEGTVQSYVLVPNRGK